MAPRHAVEPTSGAARRPSRMRLAPPIVGALARAIVHGLAIVPAALLAAFAAALAA